MRKKTMVGILTALLLAGPVWAQGSGKAPEAAHNSFGVFGDACVDTGEVDLGLTRELGSKKTRINLLWDWIEPQKNQFHSDKADRVIEAHYREGIDIVATICCNSTWGTTYTQGVDTHTSSFPKDIPAYIRFIKVVVNRYKPAIKYWQLENEVGDKRLFPTQYWDGTVAEYVELLRITNQAIKSVDPGAKVVLSGIPLPAFIMAYDEGDTNLRMVLEYMLQHSKDHCDVIDFHQYCNIDRLNRGIAHLKRKMNEYYGYEKELICTESGDLSLMQFADHLVPGGYVPIVAELLAIPEVYGAFIRYLRAGMNPEMNPEGAKTFVHFLKTHPESQPILERYQAENLVKRITYALSQGVQQVMWLGIRDYSPENAVDWFWVFMPLTDADGRKKPHYYSYRIMIEKLKGFSEAQTIVFDDEKVVLRFDFEDRDPAHVTWSRGDAIEVNLAPLLTTSKAYISHIVTELNLENNPINPAPEVIEATSIPISETPVFVEPYPQDATPQDPSGLEAELLEPVDVQPRTGLSWEDNSDNEIGFIIERGTDGVNFSEIAEVGVDRAGYTDSDIQPGFTYYYRVYAYNDLGSSFNSNIEKCEIPNVVRIDLITPERGDAGSILYIFGRNFGIAQDIPQGVVFSGNGVTAGAQVIIWSPNFILCRVPDLAAAAYDVRVAREVAGQSNAGQYTVKPKITAMTPSSGTNRIEVEISGTGFGVQDEYSKVYFYHGNRRKFADIIEWSNNYIKCLVPAYPPGLCSVRVKKWIGRSNAKIFTITP